LIAELGDPTSRATDGFEDISDLRRFFRREMFRIQAASICQGAPVFETLQQTSDLADAAIAACYRMAVQHVAASHPPVDP
jgi:glutamine synthetase adenylyltransferase